MKFLLYFLIFFEINLQYISNKFIIYMNFNIIQNY